MYQVRPVPHGISVWVAKVALCLVAVNTVASLVVASHLWWARSSGYQKYADIVSLMKERRTSAAGGLSDGLI